MFDVVHLDLSSQWHTPTLGQLAELLVFYDRVHIRAPLGRIGSLVPKDLPDLAFFRDLVEHRRIILTIDQLPLGEVAWELGLFQNMAGHRSDPDGAPDRFREAYPTYRSPVMTLRHGDPAYAKAYLADWERIMTAAWDPVQTQADYFERLIPEAREKMKLITDPAFLRTALEAYGESTSPSIRALLQKVEPRMFEVAGEPIAGLDAPGVSTAAEMFEFLSQSDGLLKMLQGKDDRDTFTSPDFDRWSHRLVADSLSRLGVREDIAAFQTSVLGRSTIAQAVDGEAHAFREIETLLDRREPFAAAVRNRPIDMSLAKAYFDEIGKTSWLTHGPGKVVRFSLVTGAGIATGALMTPVAGVVAGTALGAVDTFVVDKLIKGNACRAFVEGPLADFVT